MKIALLWDSDYPWDVRVEKVSRALYDDGHDVHIICRNIAQRTQDEVIDSIRIHRLPILVKFSKWFNSILTFPAFFNPFWLFHIGKVIKNERIDYLIVRDLPLCPAALWVSRIKGIPCAMDMAECYPELLRCIWRFEKKRFINIFVRNPKFADYVERYCISRLTKIFVMVDESKDRLLRLGVPTEKIVISSNTPSADFISDSYLKKTDNESITLLYLGILNPSRGLETVIKGMAVLKSEGVRCRLKIAGTGKAESDLKKLSEELGVNDVVSFLGWVDRNTINKLFQDIDIGVVPHHYCNHWNSTIPNKLFDYMAAGIPVISTNVIPMMRIINECRSGVIYDDFNEFSFVQGVLALSDYDVRSNYGENGRRSIKNKYNWGVDSKALIASLS